MTDSYFNRMEINSERSAESQTVLAPSQPLCVSPIVEADLQSVVLVHSEAFKGFFLSILGNDFLYELYRGFLDDRRSIFLKAVLNSNVEGFVVGTTEPDAFFKQLMVRRWPRFVVASLSGVTRRPWLTVWKLITAPFYRGDSPGKLLGRGTLLSSIAVTPNARNRGTGCLLVEAFCAGAADRGSDYVYLITDRDNNDDVNGFYIAAGFKLESSFEKTGGRWMNRYVKDVSTGKYLQ